MCRGGWRVAAMSEKALRSPRAAATRTGTRTGTRGAARSGSRDRGKDTTATNANPSWLAALAQRSVSALVLMPLVIALVFFGGWVAFGGAVLALLLGDYELHALLLPHG